MLLTDMELCPQVSEIGNEKLQRMGVASIKNVFETSGRPQQIGDKPK